MYLFEIICSPQIQLKKDLCGSEVVCFVKAFLEDRKGNKGWKEVVVTARNGLLDVKVHDKTLRQKVCAANAPRPPARNRYLHLQRNILAWVRPLWFYLRTEHGQGRKRLWSLVKSTWNEQRSSLWLGLLYMKSYLNTILFGYLSKYPLFRIL